MVEYILHLITIGFVAFSQLPASNSYKIHNYGFGSGGTSNSSSATYSLNGISGEQSGPPANSTTYTAKTGNNQTQQANVPLAPTFDNPSNYYSKLRLIINQSANPSDAKFAVAISTDDFATTEYVQNDGTIGTNLGAEDYQTYSAWGGASGSFVVGLLPSTTYKVKVKSMHGGFTETGYGPVASATTSPPSLTYDIDVASGDAETSPPYQIDFGNLLPGSVSTGASRVWIDIDTNAEHGAKVYLGGSSGGLASTTVSYTINSASGDLSTLNEGFGAQSISAAQASGGPLTSSSPYNAAGENIGIVSSLLREIYNSANPVTGGRASFVVKAKSHSQTPSADDYQETLTAIAAASF